MSFLNIYIYIYIYICGCLLHSYTTLYYCSGKLFLNKHNVCEITTSKYVHPPGTKYSRTF